MKTIIYIWKNFKTTIASVIWLLTVFALGREYIAQDTAELITQIVAIVWTGANMFMKKQ